MMDYSEETGLPCQKCQAEDISGSITKEGKVACSECMSAKKDPWLWETYEGIGDIEATPEVRPNPQYEGTTPKKQGVGMFESDLWEHEMGGGTMRGGWKLPHARGGFAHSPTVTSPRSSKYSVPTWEKVRTYASDHPEKAVKDIVKDLGISQPEVSKALLGKEGRGPFGRNHPDLERIVPAQSLQVQKIQSTRRMFTGVGDDSEVDEREAIKERAIELFKEKTLDGLTTQADAIEEIAEELNIGYALIKTWMEEAGVYSREKSMLEMGGKRSKTLLARKGTTQEDVEEYIRSFGEEVTDLEVSEALNIDSGVVAKARKRLGLGPYRTVKRDRETKRIDDYILRHNDYMTSEQIADALNISVPTITVHRRKLGIVGLGKQIGGLSRIRGGLKYQKRYEEIKDYLLEHAGKVPDSHIIENLRISSGTMVDYRKELGLPKWTEGRGKGKRGARGQGK